MSKSVYIAAPWKHKPDALIAQGLFEEAGWTVTSHWIKYHSDAQPGNEKDFGELRIQAHADLDAVKTASLFVILNLLKSEGKATELGYAYALGKPIILVGERERNIFYYLDSIHQVDTIQKAIEYGAVLVGGK